MSKDNMETDQPSPQNQNPADKSSVALPPPLHQSDADEDDENVKQLRECSSVYLALQDCLANSNRNWKACQKEVQALKVCNEKRQSGKHK